MTRTAAEATATSHAGTTTEVAALPAFGRWRGTDEAAIFDADGLTQAVARVREPCTVVQRALDGRVGVAFGGTVETASAGEGEAVLGLLPPLYPEWLGDRSFGELHGCRFPYVAGAMANGIASTELVIAAARAGVLSFFGAAGLMPERIEAAAATLTETLRPASLPFGMNLIHAPHEADIEDATVDLYLAHGIDRVSASAYLDLTPMVVRYALSGLHRGTDGKVERRNHVFAKISRPEVAARFLSPAPAAMVQALRDTGRVTAEEAELAAHLPVAEDITVEADSGGHTDNQILGAVFPTILQLRDQLVRRHGYERPIRVGAAGGIGTPSAAAAAFSLGAAYVLTGSVNQAAVESGLSTRGKAILAQAALGDVMMAPAADMFEMGVKVQVLKRGTMFGVRAQRLYELYRTYDSLEAIPAVIRTKLEAEVFRDTIEHVWESTRAFFAARDPRENDRAARDPKHRMALVFRWYLGMSSRWAIAGEASRALDYQMWCGPAMGAFNAWVKGSFLEEPAQRSVAQIAKNLLEGAAAITRAGQLRTYGVPVPAAAFDFRPRPLD